MRDDAAAHLGLRAERERWIVLLLAAALTACAVCVSGIIGFVGGWWFLRKRVRMLGWGWSDDVHTSAAYDVTDLAAQLVDGSLGMGYGLTSSTRITRRFPASIPVVPLTANGGPHGMHTIGDAWVSRHGDVAEGSGRQPTAHHLAEREQVRGPALRRAGEAALERHGGRLRLGHHRGGLDAFVSEQ